MQALESEVGTALGADEDEEMLDVRIVSYNLNIKKAFRCRFDKLA